MTSIVTNFRPRYHLKKDPSWTGALEGPLLHGRKYKEFCECTMFWEMMYRVWEISRLLWVSLPKGFCLTRGYDLLLRWFLWGKCRRTNILSVVESTGKTGRGPLRIGEVVSQWYVWRATTVGKGLRGSTGPPFDIKDCHGNLHFQHKRNKWKQNWDINVQKVFFSNELKLNVRNRERVGGEEGSSVHL